VPVKKNDMAKILRRRVYSMVAGGSVEWMWKVEERKAVIYMEMVEARWVVIEAVVNLENMALREAKRPEERAMACQGVLEGGDAMTVMMLLLAEV
jgi:hypothetical protein